MKGNGNAALSDAVRSGGRETVSHLLRQGFLQIAAVTTLWLFFGWKWA